jgi:hypothetical protein
MCFVRNPSHYVGERRRVGLNQLNGVCDNRASERLTLLTSGLVSLIENAQQLWVCREHVPVEAGGDLIGVLSHDRRRRRYDGVGTWRQQGGMRGL